MTQTPAFAVIMFHESSSFIASSKVEPGCSDMLIRREKSVPKLRRQQYNATYTAIFRAERS